MLWPVRPEKSLVVAPLLDFTLADVPVSDAGSATVLYNTIQKVD